MSIHYRDRVIRKAASFGNWISCGFEPHIPDCLPDLLEQIETPKDIRHYDLAVHDTIARGLEKADRLGKRDLFLRHIDELMAYPAMQYRPLPQALRFHQSKKKFRWALGGNRASKSFALAMEVYWFATGQHPYRKIRTPNAGLYCTMKWDDIGNILWKQKMAVLLRPMILAETARVVWRNKQKFIPDTIYIQVPGGESQIVFKAYEQGDASYQGTEWRYVANDEQFPEEVFTEQISRIGALEEDLDFFTALTPIRSQPWLEERLTTDIPQNYDVFEFPLDDNRESLGGFIPDWKIDQLIDAWAEEIQPTRRYGKWASFVGGIYKSFNRQVHVVKESDDKLFFPRPDFLRNQHSSRAIDFGANDPFVCIWGVRIPHFENAWFIYDEYYWDTGKKGVQRLISEHAKEIHDRTKKWNAAVLRTWADHDKQERHEFHNQGISSFPARKEPRLDGIETVQAAMKYKLPDHKPKFFISERCKNTIRELAGYRWKDVTANKDTGDAPVEKDDHGPDCCRYLLHSEKVGAASGAVMSGGNNDRRTMQ